MAFSLPCSKLKTLKNKGEQSKDYNPLLVKISSFIITLTDTITKGKKVETAQHRNYS